MSILGVDLADVHGSGEVVVKCWGGQWTECAGLECWVGVGVAERRHHHHHDC